MLNGLHRKLNSLAGCIALLLAVQLSFPGFALAAKLGSTPEMASLGQSQNGPLTENPSFIASSLLLAEAAVEAPAVDEADAAAAEAAEKAEAKKLKEAEKAAKKAAKAEAKRLEAEEEAAEEAAKAEAKAAKKAAKAEAKKAKEAAKATAEQAIAPVAGTQVAATSAVSVPDDFSALTPEEKKQYFMSKKGAFKPTPEAIAEKVKTGMSMKKGAIPPEISEKINAKMKGKEGFMPTPESISKKISDGMKMVKDKVEDVVED